MGKAQNFDGQVQNFNGDFFVFLQNFACVKVQVTVALSSIVAGSTVRD